MPKKEKDKDKKRGQEAKKPQAAADPLPQVWLPDQLEITALGYDKGPRITTGGGGGGEAADGSAALPTQDEEESMARFWAMEDANAPRGWEEEQELDYEEMARKAAVSRQRDLHQSHDSAGTPDLFSYAQTSSFSVRFLGTVPNVTPQSNIGSSESQISTLEAIDSAQRQGRVPWVTSSSDMCILSLSKYGIKVTDEKKQRVFSRYPLHTIANITYYEDTYGKHMVVLRMGKPQQSKGTINELIVYECSDEPQAKDICLTLAQAFDAVYNKIKLERNLHTSDVR